MATHSGILLVDNEPRSGAWNMAVDEVLLDEAATTGRCFLRWYEWCEPTVSLGYFQPAESLRAHPELAELAAVRRLSGGGAIVHHHEWTYSCTLASGHPLARAPRRLYTEVHSAMIDVLARHGVRTRLCGGPTHAAEQATPPADEPAFLCFARRDERDVVLDDRKILGSAQRRRRGAVLQHGSLLLVRSRHAPQFPGLFDLVPHLREVRDLRQRLVEAVARVLNIAPERQTLDEQLHSRVQELARSRYASIASSRGTRRSARG